MELTIAIGIVALAVGTVAGMILASRHFDYDCEISYLSGHVDGYNKAVIDCGGEPL